MALWARTGLSMRAEFLAQAAAGEGEVSFSQLCRRYSVSRTTGYKWLARWKAEGLKGCEERSRRPHHSPRRTDDAIEQAVLAVRMAHPCWGGRKIATVVKRHGGSAPAPSTVTAILRRHGVWLGRTEGAPEARGRFEHQAPNDLWQMDFKGHVAMQRGGRCHPLTVLDDHSRYNLVTAACPNQTRGSVEAELRVAFERHGKPWRILCDNGAPWGDSDQSGHSGLSVWLMEHDIAVSHSRPYHPQTMGKDERYHRTMKAEVMGRAFLDLDDAQGRFDRFRHDYNHVRPHEGIGMQVPADRYKPSPRAFTSQPTGFEYGPDDIVRSVCTRGRIGLAGRRIRLSKALAGKRIALRPTARDGVFTIVFRSFKIGTKSLLEADAET
jgi:transposase InsO family protein